MKRHPSHLSKYSKSTTDEDRQSTGECRFEFLKESDLVKIRSKDDKMKKKKCPCRPHHSSRPRCSLHSTGFPTKANDYDVEDQSTNAGSLRKSSQSSRSRSSKSSIDDNTEKTVEDSVAFSEELEGEKVDECHLDDPWDSFEESRHDQLPSIKEAKMTTPPSCLHLNKFKVWAVVLVGLVIISVGVLITQRNKQRQPPDRLSAIISFLAKNQISPALLLTDQSSPQHRAAQFLANGDAYNMALNEITSRRFVERYVLAVLWYQLNGSQWTYKAKFMSAQDHCNWFENLKSTSGNALHEGVLCDSDGYVSALNLGTCWLHILWFCV